MGISMFDCADLVITPEMLTLIAEVDEFKGAWQLFGRLSPDRLQTLRKVATIESVGSSTRIEGSKLSDREVEALLSRIDNHSFRSRDEQEVGGYAYVCEEIFSSYASIPFTENAIKQLHGWLLTYSEKDQRHRGEYKKLTNNIEAFNAEGKSLGIVFETSAPFETPAKMEEIVFWVREMLETRALHPLLVIGIFILVFLAIHPFQDGNGRLSRSLTTLLMLKSGYLYVPYSSLESVIEENKEGYYLALRRSQQSLKGKKPDLSSWLLFFLRSLQKQKSYLEKKVSKEKILHLHLHELAAEMIELVAQHGRLTISELLSMTGANRNTLKKYLEELSHSGHLLRHGKGRGVWYTLN